MQEDYTTEKQLANRQQECLLLGDRAGELVPETSSFSHSLAAAALEPGETPGSGAAPQGGYLDLIANVSSHEGFTRDCPGWFVRGECEHGHRFAKELYCGREWCPICGAEDSQVHKRRFARWLPKVQQMKRLGYFVFTIPMEVRSQYRTKASLSLLTKRATAGDTRMRIDGLLKGEGFKRGLARWHWFGDKSNVYHPHLNVFVDGGYIAPGQLEYIKKAWANILGVEKADVFYEYTGRVPKMLHLIKYVTRATFLDYQWDGRMAAELYNFRNVRAWGRWEDLPAWDLPAGDDLGAVRSLESGLCPTCGEPIAWSKPTEINYLKIELSQGQGKSLGAGYWSLGP